MLYADVVEGIYRATDEGANWQAALRMVSLRCRASAAVLLTRDAGTGRIAFAADFGLPGTYRAPYTERFRHGDLRLEDLIRHPVGTVRTDTMIPDYEAYTRSAAYRQLYRQLGTEHALGGFVHEAGGRAFAVRVFRSRADGAFGSQEIKRFASLTPHLARSLDLSIRLARARAAESLARGVAEFGSMPAGILRADGSVAAFGPLGQTIRTDDRARARAALRRLLAEPDRRATRPRRTTFTLGDGRAATLTMATEIGDGALHDSDAPVAFMDVRDDDVLGRVKATVAAHGLTAAEARLVSALCEGLTLAQSAQRFGVARETVKSQIRSVFQKLGVSRQADVLRRVLSPRVARSES
ncbi:MAG: helix-turn-helix transcriptional regulator [Alphaproteobacteria bacterium]|nr:helix-turn-helix transcriptional regulator [Alphaproteobacteria bacterium]